MSYVVHMQLWRINETTFNFRVYGGQFWGVNSNGALVATATTTPPGPSETFQIVRRDSDKTRVRIRAPNGLFLQVIITEQYHIGQEISGQGKECSFSFFIIVRACYSSQ
jgi:hypothetical protein